MTDALEQTILPNVADTSKNYLYSTLWTIISKNDKKMVGDLCFVGTANAEGEIEIGYGTYDTFTGKGFMTEAVDGMISWAIKQPEIHAIIADTEKLNTASFRVLEKNGFVNIAETETLLKWKLSVKSIENEVYFLKT